MDKPVHTRTPRAPRLLLNVHPLRPGVTLVSAEGVLDRHTAGQLEQCAAEAIRDNEASPIRMLLLEMSEIRFLDRAGVDVLIKVQNRMAASGGEVEVVAPSPSVIQMMHEVPVDRPIPIYRAADPPADPAY